MNGPQGKLAIAYFASRHILLALGLLAVRKESDGMFTIRHAATSVGIVKIIAGSDSQRQFGISVSGIAGTAAPAFLRIDNIIKRNGFSLNMTRCNSKHQRP